MSNILTPPDDEIPAEIDFSGGTRGKFYRLGATLNLPLCSWRRTAQSHLNAKGVDFSALNGWGHR